MAVLTPSTSCHRKCMILLKDTVFYENIGFSYLKNINDHSYQYGTLPNPWKRDPDNIILTISSLFCILLFINPPDSNAELFMTLVIIYSLEYLNCRLRYFKSKLGHMVSCSFCPYMLADIPSGFPHCISVD